MTPDAVFLWLGVISLAAFIMGFVMGLNMGHKWRNNQS